MIAAEVRNADNAILRTLNVPDGFVAPAHKYGADKPSRIVPVENDQQPEHNSETHHIVSVQTVEAGRVVNGWQTVANPTPSEVPNWALEEELSERGLIDGLNAAINSLPAGASRNKARARWNKKPTIRRNDPLVAALAQVLALTSAQVDDIFSAASRRQ